uniref:Putative dehydrin 10 n=1 Tax=Davidia involucrata TaxID=16924 RepID=A0A5B7AGZ8_DAVIN
MNTSQSSIAGASQNNMESTNQSSKREGSWKISRTRSMAVVLVVVLVVHVIKTRARRRRRRIRRRSTRTDTSTAIAAAATAIRSFHMHFSTTHRRMEWCEKGFYVLLPK